MTNKIMEILIAVAIFVFFIFTSLFFYLFLGFYLDNKDES